MTEHISKQYDQDLETIRSRTMQMGGLVEAQIRAAVGSYLDGDPQRIEQAIAGDVKVNELEIAIDAEFQSILRQLITFMMEDPRAISTSINIIWAAKAFERIGDHAKNIAEQVIYIVKGRDVRHTPLAEVQREAMR